MKTTSIHRANFTETINKDDNLVKTGCDLVGT